MRATANNPDSPGRVDLEVTHTSTGEVRLVSRQVNPDGTSTVVDGLMSAWDAEEMARRFTFAANRCKEILVSN